MGQMIGFLSDCHKLLWEKEELLVTSISSTNGFVSVGFFLHVGILTLYLKR